MDTMIFNGVGRSSGNFKSLSTQDEAKINSKTIAKKMVAPTGVRRFLVF